MRVKSVTIRTKPSALTENYVDTISRHKKAKIEVLRLLRSNNHTYSRACFLGEPRYDRNSKN